MPQVCFNKRTYLLAYFCSGIFPANVYTLVWRKTSSNLYITIFPAWVSPSSICTVLILLRRFMQLC